MPPSSVQLNMAEVALIPAVEKYPRPILTSFGSAPREERVTVPSRPSSLETVTVPNEEEKWASIDYSQQEPRILVHFAALYQKRTGKLMPKVNEFVDGYKNNPDMDFHTMVADMADIPRKQAKVINLGMMYGMGVGKLGDQLDLSGEEAK